MNKLFGPKLFFIITISILIGCGILLFTRMVGRELILVVIFATIIVFFSLGVGLSWVYVTEKNIVIFKNLFMRTEYKWEKFDEITYSTQGSSGGDGKSFYAATSYRFFSNKILGLS